MKYHALFKEKLGCNDANATFDYLISSLKDTITGWNYFVNWEKVNDGIRRVEIDLNLLNYLIGKDNIEEEAIKLLREHPKAIKTIPILLACRDSKFDLLKEYQNGSFSYDEFDFSKKIDLSPEKAVEFLSNSGFLEQLKTKRIKSLVDYVFGVEVGLDSNGRKNRGGTAMESIVEFFVADICKRNGYEYLAQATAPKIKQKWNKSITVDKSSRIIDFAINTPQKLFLIEVNFYGGGGSKLKSTAGEYVTDFHRWSADSHQFIWITDGAGWRSTHLPLRDTFNATDYILNLDMVEKGVLEGVILL
ncbi:MAG: type II restriction endonuclease [Rickettsiales bacterium]